MKTSTENIKYGNQTIEFELLQEDRKTMAIEVLPTEIVKVKVPINKDKQEILQKVQKKAKWISKQKQYFSENYKQPQIKKYISGETFKYLGKQYRLKLIRSDNNSVKLKQGYLVVEYSTKKTKNIVNQWYKDKARSIFEKELEKCLKSFSAFNVRKPDLKIRKLNKRWGSYNKNNNTITMNIATIKANKSCIDYVIFHELCHCIYFAHNKDFYNLLESKCPNWKKYKTNLEKITIFE